MKLFEKYNEKRKKIERKYWKLSSGERLHYDSKIKELRKSTSVSIFELFRIYFIIFGLAFLFLSGFIYFYGNGIINFKEVGEKLFKTMILDLPLVIVFYIIYSMFSSFYYWKESNKLKKRFKLLEDKN